MTSATVVRAEQLARGRSIGNAVGHVVERIVFPSPDGTPRGEIAYVMKGMGDEAALDAEEAIRRARERTGTGRGPAAAS